ncbi:PLP-dependent transferase [Xylaria acuta]|nr:PLP-dependent transferase [Xylaria acuta]
MLSARGARWAQIGYAHGAQNRYHAAKKPQGAVSFDDAENWLVHSDLTRFINTLDFDEPCRSYGEGYTGNLRLREAMANHMNKHFEPASPIDAEEITFAAGVTDLNEACAPVYGAFSRDLSMRTGVDLEYVSVGNTDQFTPACVVAFEAGYEEARARGRNIKALIICNPHNPLGHCYPREALIGLLQLCARKKIHLISDEIYALSDYNRTDRPSEVFTSVRSIDFSGIIDPKLVHILYGISKDFGAGGMRLGCIFTEKSNARLLHHRLVAESLLSQAGIGFHDKGNAELFIWLDLSPFLPVKETNGDGWSAQKLLLERLEQAGVSMSTGESYRAPDLGMFRIIFSLDEESLREGIRRISRVVSGASVE